jgi:5-formyltetrahydrofolate cyclo-ligase
LDRRAAAGGGIAERKRALRSAAAAARRQLDERQRRAASAAICDRILALPELRSVRTVLLYAATPVEADPAALIEPLRGRGVRLLYPRVRGDELDLVAAADLAALEHGFRGIREPVGPRVDPEAVDVALVPGVAFDPCGGRLGHGGGHYDRLLGQLRDDGVRIGVCFACQVVPRVPLEDHDEAVDLVVTEHATYHADERPTPA